MKNSPKLVEEQTSTVLEACNSDDNPGDDTPVSTTGNQFNISGGTQYNNTGNGNQFLGSQFHGDVNFVESNGGNGKSKRSRLTPSSNFLTKGINLKKEGRPRS
jgi:hypothetical protein